jgi:hypothetical protein
VLLAAQRPGGWALAKLAGRGWFEPSEHLLNGQVFRITAAGRGGCAVAARAAASTPVNGESG